MSCYFALDAEPRSLSIYLTPDEAESVVEWLAEFAALGADAGRPPALLCSSTPLDLRAPLPERFSLWSQSAREAAGFEFVLADEVAA